MTDMHMHEWKHGNTSYLQAYLKVIHKQIHTCTNGNIALNAFIVSLIHLWAYSVNVYKCAK